MNPQDEVRLIEALEEKLRPYSFERLGKTSFRQTLSVPAAWKRKTWNTNRAIVALSLSGQTDELGRFAQTAKMPVGRAVGYVPFFYSLGLQLILIGDSLLRKTDGLEKSLDKYDNQRVVLQSIHVVDLALRKSVSVRTWGQYETGRFQDAIESGIQTFFTEPGVG
jgi:hypothetical protein